MTIVARAKGFTWVGLALTSLVVVVSQIAAAAAFHPASAADLVSTATVLELDDDSTGTVRVTASGVTPQGVVDLWVDSTWQRAYTLVDGEVDIDLGTQTLGDHKITARYRGDSITSASITTISWTTPGTVAVATTTEVELGVDGTGTITVDAAADGGALTAQVDVWVDSVWLKAFSLVDGRASLDLGVQTVGDHSVTARYRGNSTSKPSQVTVKWTAPGTVAVATTTALELGVDGKGTIKVAGTGVVPAGYVDVWVDSVWLKAFSLVDGRASLDLGVQTVGDHTVTARYRGNSTAEASQKSVKWSLTSPEQVATTSKVSVLPDGTGTIEVSAEDGSSPNNVVDLWVEGQYKQAHSLVDGKATFALGTRAGGEQLVVVRYRPGPAHSASTASAVWSIDTNSVPDSSACGDRILKVDGEAWKCTFADDFNGSVLDASKWKIQGELSNCYTELWCYTNAPENVSVSDGQLHLTLLRKELAPRPGDESPITAYVSGMVTTYHAFSQQYGRFEARMKNTAATAPGLHEAFWLWPDDRYPEGQGTPPTIGEIDISETYSKHPEISIPYLHSSLDSLGSQLTGPDTNTAYDCLAQRGVFNTYTLEWAPERIEIFVNGTSCMVNTSGNEAFKKRFIMAISQALGRNENAPGEGMVVPATTSVDYVRAWS